MKYHNFYTSYTTLIEKNCFLVKYYPAKLHQTVNTVHILACFEKLV